MKTKYALRTARKPSWENAVLLAITALILCASSALAQTPTPTTTWRDGTGSWFEATNWDNGVPNSTTAAQLNNGGTAQISADVPKARALSLTLGLNPHDSGTVQVSPPHGDLIVEEAIFVGYRARGNVAITDGHTVTSATASIASLMGELWISNGSVKVDGTGSIWTVAAGFEVGGYNGSPGGTALLSVTNGGTVSAVSVHVYKSGTLTGNGTVMITSPSTPLASIDGTLAPSGTLTINGDLTFTNPAATMRCNVTSSSWDRAEISGAATLNGILSVTLSGFFTGDFPLLHASVLTGEFSSYSFTYTGCLSPSIVYDRVNGYVYLHVESTCQ